MGFDLSNSFWKGKYLQLNADEQKVCNSLIPGMLFLVDISTISKKSIDHIICRLREYEYEAYIRLPGKSFQKKFKFIEKFIGFKINIKTLTSQEFARKRMRKSLNNIPRFGKNLIKILCPSWDALRKQCE